MSENSYSKIGDKLNTSIKKLYENSEHILQEIEEGLDEQQKEYPIVGCQGVEGSFGEQASVDYFGERMKSLKTYTQFEEVLEAVNEGEIDYGVLPIENSSAGEVLEVYDLINKYNLYIVGEQSLRVKHHLLGIKGAKISDISKVYSHPQAFSQCKEYLKAHPNMSQITCVNTAIASKQVAEEGNPKKAAIGSKRAAELYQLEILDPEINTSRYNFTRFIILSKKMEIRPECNKISILFDLPHTTGSLYSVLAHFAYNGLNLLKIQSRPIKDQTWEYFFFLDLEGNLQDVNVLIALGKIKEHSKYLRILGNYPEHSI